MTLDELTDVTPESRAYCARLIEGRGVRLDLFTPIGLKPTVLFPGTNGGANWGGASFDPETRTLYVNSMDVGMVSRMVKRPEGAVVPYRTQGFGTPNSRFWDTQLHPCQKPPWGHSDGHRSEHRRVPLAIRAGRGGSADREGIPPTGTSNIGGSHRDCGRPGVHRRHQRQPFPRVRQEIRAKRCGSTKLPASAHATPMTYLGKKTKKQFVVIAAGGGNKYNDVYSDSLVAYSLP